MTEGAPGSSGDYVLRALLSPAGRVPYIGRERTMDVRRHGDVSILVHSSEHGSTRYVAVIEDEPVAVLQVVSRNGVDALVANAFTLAPWRRRGLASMLLKEARTDFATVVHSDMLSREGAAFARSTG